MSPSLWWVLHVRHLWNDRSINDEHAAPTTTKEIHTMSADYQMQLPPQTLDNADAKAKPLLEQAGLELFEDHVAGGTAVAE